ncbi:unnamed protein product, partial [Ectocarpus sp. 12 AP-2014]
QFGASSKQASRSALRSVHIPADGGLPTVRETERPGEKASSKPASAAERGYNTHDRQGPPERSEKCHHMVLRVRCQRGLPAVKRRRWDLSLKHNPRRPPQLAAVAVAVASSPQGSSVATSSCDWRGYRA